ncbi:tyrosine-type recombinase/integrase [Xanthobacter flavus]|uniref:tyrosine-type recombinase/integrase n=1 Tax=Xanthobacter flavus TaxID=281 RepID=UPI003729FF75
MGAERVAKLTKRVIDATASERARFVLWDAEVKGFGLRVEPSGAKSFLVRYRAGTGRGAPLRQLKLGAYGVLTVDQARAKAKELLAQVAAGQDPGRERTEQRAAMTLRELAALFMSEHVAVKRKPNTYRSYRFVLDNHVVPALGTLKAADVTRADVAGLHRRMKGSPCQANRMVAVLGAVYTFAERGGLVPEGVNPARKVEMFKEKRRDRFLAMAEFERLGAALAAAEATGVDYVDRGKPVVRRLSPYSAAAIRLLLLTGARLREITSLRWEYVDLERRCLRLPDSKTGAKVVPLNAPAMKVLAELPREEGNPFVIVGQKPGQPITALHKAWNVVRDAAGLDGLRIHDLRHSFASVGAGGGVGLQVIGKLLGHTQAATTQRYAHIHDDPLRVASELIGGRVGAALGLSEPATEGGAEVVSIKGGKA